MASAAWAHPALAGRRNLEGVNGGHGQLRPAGIDDIDVEALRRRLENTVRGDVLFDAGHRAIYSHDSSNYRQPPLGVVCPRDTEDLVAAVAAARERCAPVLPRGCGTGLSGATCNVAVVIDTSKYMREHFGQGCMHCRISFDLRSPAGIEQWRRFLDEAADLVISYSLSGEHGDGRQRAELLLAARHAARRW